MTGTLMLYTHPMSRGRITRWMLEETGQPYETEIVPIREPRTEAFLAVNPMGKVPVLRHGDVTLTENAAICAYLADAFPQAGLAPATDSPLRAAYYRWLFMVAGPLEAAMVNHAMGVEVREEHTGMLGYGTFERIFGLAEAELEGTTHLVGDSFTTADLLMIGLLQWGMSFELVEKRPAFVAYVKHHAARPALGRARALDDALLEQFQQPA